ncbi:bacterial dynamin-like protein [Abditibacteriota bacterium]|nr:bacterial dynamin-like protein [Abditibacteriota bacterium]
MAIEIKPERERALKEAGGAVDQLAAVATALGMKEAAAKLHKTHDQMKSDTFNLIVLGRFKTGKSTLMNALLGRLTKPVPELGGKGAMATNPLPCTAILTSIRYSDTPYVKVWKMDGKSENWSLERYLKDSRVRANERETQTFFAGIREFEIGLPVELCQQGITLWDSPGLDDMPERDIISKQAVEICDAGIVNYISMPAIGHGEREFAEKTVQGSGVRVFSVVNMFMGQPADDQFKAFVWDRLVTMSGGGDYNGQDPNTRDIFFVNSLQAEQSRLKGDESGVEQSGLAPLEGRLTDFLLKERHRVHLERHIKAAELQMVAVEQGIGRQRAALETDQQKLKQAFAEIQPKLAMIRARREKLPTIFERYGVEVQRELKSSFEAMISQLRRDLPVLARKQPLESIKKTGAGLRPSVVEDECRKICNRIIEDRVQSWSSAQPSEAGARQSLQPILDRLKEEIIDEFARIDRDYRDVHFQLTGWQPEVSTTPEADDKGRVGPIVASIFAWDVAGLSTGGRGGYRAAGGAIAGQLIGGLALGLLGVGGILVLPVAILAGVLGSLVFTRMGLEDRCWKAVLEKSDAFLQSVPVHAAPKIEASAAETLKELETVTMEEAGAMIQDEENNIRRMLEVNQRDQSSKDQEKVKLDTVTNTVANQKMALKNVLLRVAQTMQ